MTEIYGVGGKIKWLVLTGDCQWSFAIAGTGTYTIQYIKKLLGKQGVNRRVMLVCWWYEVFFNTIKSILNCEESQKNLKEEPGNTWAWWTNTCLLQQKSERHCYIACLKKIVFFLKSLYEKAVMFSPVTLSSRKFKCSFH